MSGIFQGWRKIGLQGNVFDKTSAGRQIGDFMYGPTEKKETPTRYYGNLGSAPPKKGSGAAASKLLGG